MFSTTITSEMVNEFIAKALNAGIDLGGRILAALIIFIIGKFLINWANKLFAAMLQRRTYIPRRRSRLDGRPLQGRSRVSELYGTA